MILTQIGRSRRRQAEKLRVEDIDKRAQHADVALDRLQIGLSHRDNGAQQDDVHLMKELKISR
jgi:hypothetical protein